MGHACELETSIYLAIDADAVRMDLAVAGRNALEGEHFWLDWTDGPLHLMPWWNALSPTGVHGDPTVATAEKGVALLDAAVEECVGYLRELRGKPLPVLAPPSERA
jgi:creatinine amidohydrolase